MTGCEKRNQLWRIDLMCEKNIGGEAPQVGRGGESLHLACKTGRHRERIKITASRRVMRENGVSP